MGSKRIRLCLAINLKNSPRPPSSSSSSSVPRPSPKLLAALSGSYFWNLGAAAATAAAFLLRNACDHFLCHLSGKLDRLRLNIARFFLRSTPFFFFYFYYHGRRAKARARFNRHPWKYYFWPFYFVLSLRDGMRGLSFFISFSFWSSFLFFLITLSIRQKWKGGKKIFSLSCL